MSEAKVSMGMVDGGNAEADLLTEHDGDIGCLRPWLDGQGNVWVSVKGADGKLQNRMSSLSGRLSRQRWINLDHTVTRAFREHAPVVSGIIEEKVLVYNLPTGMAHTALHNKTVTDVPKSPDHPPFIVEHFLPLPITHHDCFSDNESVETSARLVAEAVEKAFLGVDGLQPIHGGVELTKGLLKVPVLGTFQTEEEALGVMVAAGFYGPYQLVRSDHLNGKAAFFQATKPCVRLVVGLQPTLVQWGDGFKVMCIMVPHVRPDARTGKFAVAVIEGAGFSASEIEKAKRSSGRTTEEILKEMSWRDKEPLL